MCVPVDSYLYVKTELDLRSENLVSPSWPLGCGRVGGDGFLHPEDSQ